MVGWRELVLCALLALVLGRTNLNPNEVSPNFVLFPCSEEEFFISFPYDPLSFQEIMISAKNSSNDNTIQMQVTNGLPNEDLIVIGPCTVGNTKTCSVDLTCELVSSNEWFIYVVNQDSEPVEFNITTTSRTVTPVALSLNHPYKYTGEVASTDFGTSHVFFQIPIQPPSDFAMVNFTIYDIGPNEDDIDVAVVSPSSIASTNAQTSCTTFNLPTPGTLVLTTCDIQEVAPNGGTTNWFVTVKPKPNANLTFSIEASVQDFDVAALTEGEATTVQFIDNEGDILYYSIDAPPAPEDGQQGQQLNVTVFAVQGGQVNVSVVPTYLPWEQCRADVELLCIAETRCDIVIPWCDVQQDTYYIGVAANQLSAQNQPLTYRAVVNYASPPSTAVAAKLSDNVFFSGSVGENQYRHFYFSASGYKATPDSYLDVQLYVDATDFGPTTLFVNPDALAGGAPTSCLDHFAEPCSIASRGSCVRQVFSCDYSEHTRWYMSVLGGDAANYFGSGTRFTIRAALQDPRALTADAIVQYGNVFSGEYDQWVVRDSQLQEGEIVHLELSSVVGGTLSVWLNRDQLAGDSCETNACYGAISAQSVVSVGKTFSLDLTRCADDDEDYFVGVRGERADNGTEYTMTLIRDAGPLRPLATLAKDQVITATLPEGDDAVVNYTLKDTGSKKRLVVTLTQLEPAGAVDNVLKLRLLSGSYLNCATEHSACSTASAVDRSTCQIVLQPCVFDGLDTALVQVTGAANVLFNLHYSLYSPSTTKLKSGVAVSSEVHYQEYMFYSLATSGKNSTLLVEAYFDNDNDAAGSLFVSTSGNAGLPPCYSVDTPSCTSADKCVHVVNACDLEKTTYYVSVFTGAAVRPYPSVKYTLVATELPAAVPLDFDTVTPMEIYEGQRIYHTLQVDEIDPSTGEIIAIHIGSVQDGSVTAFISFGSPLTHCPCFEHTHTMQVNAGDPVQTLSLPYCELPEAGEWTIEVVGGAADTAAARIGYTISVVNLSQKPATLKPGTSVEGNIRNNLYLYYEVTGLDPTDQATLEITNVRGGSVTVYYNGDSPATKECSRGSVCAGTTASCATQLGACIPSPHFISVLASSPDANPVYFNISVVVDATQPLALAKSVPVEMSAEFTELYSFSLPANTKGPVITVTLRNLVNGPVRITASEELCNPLSEFSRQCTGPGVCKLEIGDCDIAGDDWLLRAESLAAGGTTSFDLEYNVQATATQVYSFTNGVYNNTLTALQWRVFQIPVVVDADGPPQKQLTISMDQRNNVPAFTLFVQTEADASDYPSVGCFEFREERCAHCSIVIPPCCIQNSTYFVTVRNTFNASLSFELSYDLIEFATYTNTSLNHTSAIAADPVTLAENALVLEQQDFTSPFAFIELSGAVAENSTDRINMWLQRVSAAGTDDKCFTWFYACAGTSLCSYQLYPCAPTPVVGTYLAAVQAAQDDAADVQLTAQVVQPTHANATAKFNESIAVTDMWRFFEVTYDEAPNVLRSIEVVITRNSVLDPALELAWSQQSLCEAVAEPAGQSCQVNGIFATTCTLPIPLCALHAPVVLAVRGDSSGDAHLLVRTKQEEYINVPSNPVDITLEDAPAVVDYVVDLRNATFSAASQFIASLSISNGAVTAVDYAYDGDYCFSGSNLCAGRIDADGVCHLQLGGCLLRNERLYLRATFTFVGAQNVTLSSRGVVDQNVTTLKLNGDLTDATSSVTLFSQHRYLVDLTAASVLPGQGVQISAATVCGEVSLYANDPAFVASAQCNAYGALVDGAALSWSACDVLEAGVPDEIAITVNAVAQQEEQYAIPIYYTLVARTVGSPLSFVTVQANEMVSYNATADPLAATVYVFPIDALGDYAGQTVVEFNGPAQGQLSLYLDTLPSCAAGASFSADAGTPLPISSCDLAAHRLLYFQFSAAWPEGSSVKLLRVSPYVRDWNQVKGGLATPQLGSVASVDGEHYMFEVTPSTTDYFRLTIELAVNGGGTASFFYSPDVPPGQGGNCPDYTPCTVEGLRCVLVLDACELAANTGYVSVVGGLATSSAAYTLSITTQVPVQSLKIKESVCVQLERNEWQWFSADYGTFVDTELFELRISSVEQASVMAYINAAADASSPVPLATDRCFRDEQQCDTELGCALQFPCLAQGTVSIGVKNTANTANSFFIMWDRVDNGLVPFDDEVQADALHVRDFYSTVAPSNLTATQVFALSLDTQAVGAKLLVATASPGEQCAVEQCTGACQISDACFPLHGTIYATVLPELAPYTLTADVLSIPSTALAVGGFVESRFPADTPLASGWLPSRHVYEVSLDSAVPPTHALQLVVYGVNQGEVNVWVTAERLGDDHCAVVTERGINRERVVQVDTCAIGASQRLFVVVELAKESGECGVDVTYGLAPMLVDNQWVNGGALSDGDSRSTAVTAVTTTTYFTYDAANVTDASAVVAELLVSFTSADPDAAVTALLVPYAGGLALPCSYAVPLNTPFFINPCDLALPQSWYLVVTAGSASIPGSAFSVSVREKSPYPLASAGLVAGDSGNGTQYTVLDVDATKAASMKRSLVLQLDLGDEYAVDVALWRWTCGQRAPLSTFTCYGGECVVPFPWASERSVTPLALVTTPATPGTRYNISYSTGSDNCESDRSQLDFCSGAKYSWWRYGSASGLDDSARDMFETIYATFCPDCDCRALSKDCNDTLTRFACEYTMTPCDANGFETTMCKSTCEDVEQACGKTFAEAGWAQLECSHNWYASSSESACQVNDYSGFSSDSGGSSGWWMVLLVILAAIAIIVIVLVVGALVYFAVNNRPRQYEVISDAVDDPPPPPPVDDVE